MKTEARNVANKIASITAKEFADLDFSKKSQSQTYFISPFLLKTMVNVMKITLFAHECEYEENECQAIAQAALIAAGYTE